MKRAVLILLLCVFGLSVESVSAQELDGLYYPFGNQYEHFPEIDLDSTLFYLPVSDESTLFDRLTRYSLSSVRFVRRGVEGEVLDLDGVRISRSESYLLRRLLRREQVVDGMAAEPIDAFNGSRSYSLVSGFGVRSTQATVSATDRNKLLTIRLYDARPIGDRWSYALLLSGEGGRDMRVGGLFTQRIEAAALLSHKWCEGSMSIAAMVAPSQRGVRSASSDEAFSLTGDNLYNPSWGMHNGRERNSRVRRELMPSVAVSMRHKRWFATLYGRAGWQSISGLNWYDAPIPTPDNYRQLPSYFDSEQVRTEVERVWQERDHRYTQIDWEELYVRNAMTDGRSIYIVEDRVEAPYELRATVGGEFVVARNTTARVAVVVDHSSTEYYKRLRDLLGGTHIVDIDQYLIDDDRFGTLLQNDLRNPNRRVVQGAKFGYDYRLTEGRYGAQVGIRYHDNRYTLDVAGRVVAAVAWRTGLYEKQLFAGSGSLGRSEPLSGVEAAAKMAFRYSISAGHRLSAVVSAAREMQSVDQQLLQPAYNNALAAVDPFRAVISGELAYSLRTTSVELTAKAFAQVERDDDATMRLFDDLTYTYVDAVVSNLDRNCFGMELSASVRLSPRFTAEGALSVGSYRYASNPSVSLFADVDNRPIVVGGVSCMSGLHTAQTPTLAAVAKLRYSTPYSWRMEVEAAFASGRYVAPTPIRRMTRVTDLAASPEEFEAMTAQQRLDDALLIGLSAMRSWSIGGVQSRLTTVVSVRNLLCDKNIVYSAYEPSRVLRSGSGVNIHYRPMPERYTYAYPLSFNVSITYRFR